MYRFQAPEICCLFTLLLVLGCDSGSDVEKNADSESQSQTELSATENGGVDLTTSGASVPTASAKPDSMYSVHAFIAAAHDGKMSVIESVLESNMDINSANERGHTAIALAAYNGHTVIVKRLLANGAKVDPRDLEGKTPLIHASSEEFPETVRVLLKANANINAVDNGEGFTPLMTAAALGNFEVVKVLLEFNANRTITDDDGETALDFAMKEGHTNIAELLAKEEK